MGNTICEPFKELKELCAKHNLSINEQTLYKQRLFGKSGRYSPTDEKIYLAYSEYWCNRELNLIKKDIDNTISKYGNCYIEVRKYDDIDVANSIRNLTECYGWREVYLSVHAK